MSFLSAVCKKISDLFESSPISDLSFNKWSLSVNCEHKGGKITLKVVFVYRFMAVRSLKRNLEKCFAYTHLYLIARLFTLFTSKQLVFKILHTVFALHSIWPCLIKIMKLVAFFYYQSVRDITERFIYLCLCCSFILSAKENISCIFFSLLCKTVSVSSIGANFFLFIIYYFTDM